MFSFMFPYFVDDVPIQKGALKVPLPCEVAMIVVKHGGVGSLRSNINFV